MTKLKKIYDITNAIFTDLQALDVPWKSKNIAQSLDIAYIGNQSGNKYASPLVENFLDEDGELSTADRATIANVIYNLNNDYWTKLYNTLSFQYDPIENYHMLEEMTNDQTVTEYGKTSTRTNNLNHAKTGTEKTLYNSTDERTDDLTHTIEGSEAITYDTTDERTDDLTHSKVGSEAITYDTTDERTDDLTHAKSGSETTERGNTKTIEGGERRTPDTDTTNSVYAFNSASPAPITLAENNGTETTQYLNRSDVDAGSETTSFTDRQDTDSGTVTTTKEGTETTSFTDRADTDTGTVTTTKEGTETTSFTNRQNTDSGTVTTEKSGDDTIQYNVSDADTGTVKDVNAGEDTSTRNYTLERSGNIGVTTSQQMIESERNLWLWNFFYKVVFPDVDRVLALQIY